MSTTRGCLRNTAFGCGGLILLAIGGTVALVVLTIGPMNRAVESQQALAEEVGGEWTPPADGRIPEERFEAFHAVQATLAEHCATFEATAAQFEAMERYDRQDESEVDRLEMLGEALATTRVAFGLAPALGAWFDARNRALLAVDMSLGEYHFLYSVVFRDQLVAEGDDDTLFGSRHRDHRATRRLVDILTRYEAAARDAGEIELADALHRESEALEADVARAPWADGLPAPLAASVASWGGPSEDLYCSATAPLTALETERRGGISIEAH